MTHSRCARHVPGTVAKCASEVCPRAPLRGRAHLKGHTSKSKGEPRRGVRIITPPLQWIAGTVQCGWNYSASRSQAFDPGSFSKPVFRRAPALEACNSYAFRTPKALLLEALSAFFVVFSIARKCMIAGPVRDRISDTNANCDVIPLFFRGNPTRCISKVGATAAKSFPSRALLRGVTIKASMVSTVGPCRDAWGCSRRSVDLLSRPAASIYAATHSRYGALSAPSTARESFSGGRRVTGATTTFESDHTLCGLNAATERPE